MKDVMLWTGAGQIGMAIAKVMNEAGFDVVPLETDISSREPVLKFIAEGQKYGDIAMLVNAAGVSPSQAPVETILNHVYLSHPGEEPLKRNYCAFWRKERTNYYIEEFAKILHGMMAGQQWWYQ